jgi:hypothetical protein
MTETIPVYIKNSDKVLQAEPGDRGLPVFPAAISYGFQFPQAQKKGFF